MQNPVKLSHSALDTYWTCHKKWFLQYREKLMSKQKSSSLCIGVAFDNAFNDVLLNHGKKDSELLEIGLKSFEKAWKSQEDRYFGTIELAKNPDISYSKRDFEEGIFTEEDSEKIEAYFQELLPVLKKQTPDVEFPFVSGYELFQWQRTISKSFSYWNEASKKFYNYVNWISIQRKAPYFIEAYIQDLLPHIEKVISVQTDLNTTDEEGNTLTGIADMVLQLKPGNYSGVEVLPGEKLIADNKTSSKSYLNKSYGPDSVGNSPQLAKYKHILNTEKKMGITKGAYLVLVKELVQTKNKTCKVCGHKETGGLSQSCTKKEEKKKRCGGEWEIDITFSVETRIVVGDIPEDTEQAAMELVDETIQNINNENFEPNLLACDFQYGSPCAFRDYCHKGSMEGLVKREKK